MRRCKKEKTQGKGKALAPIKKLNKCPETASLKMEHLHLIKGISLAENATPATVRMHDESVIKYPAPSNRSRQLGDTYLHNHLLFLQDITNDPELSVSALKQNSHIWSFEISGLLEVFPKQLHKRALQSLGRGKQTTGGGCCLSSNSGGHSFQCQFISPSPAVTPGHGSSFSSSAMPVLPKWFLNSPFISLPRQWVLPAANQLLLQLLGGVGGFSS